MPAKPPSAEERKAAQKVLKYYQKCADREVGDIDQERPSEWVQSLDVTLELLKQDPDKVFAEYREEYEAGR